MNRILREQFVRLHEGTDLQRFHEELQGRYCCKRADGEGCAGWRSKGPCTLEDGCQRVRWDKIEPPPPAGDLDIGVVRDSTYFFS